MDLLPDFGTWLLRSVRRADNFNTDNNPISVVERLNSLPHPLRNADKDTLLGAVLALGPSLQLALHMLLDLLPEDESRSRLGEVLCPTLGHLQKSLEETLSCFEPQRMMTFDSNGNPLPARSKTPVPRPTIVKSMTNPELISTSSQRLTATNPVQSEIAEDNKPTFRPLTPRQQQPQHKPQTLQPILETPTKSQSPPRIPSQDQHDVTLVEKFPSFTQDNPNPPPHPSSTPIQTQTQSPHHDRPSTSRSNPAADLALMKELRAEMRVNAAIQVAVDSLEFVDGQMKIVREVHRLHGSGSFELIQNHFYEGYNRILFRALELEQREFDSPDSSPVGSPPSGRWDENGDEGYAGSGGLVSSPRKIERSGSAEVEEDGSLNGDDFEDRGSPKSTRHRLSISTQTRGPNVTPEHINTRRNSVANQAQQPPPPPMILFNEGQSEPMALPPLPPISQAVVDGAPARPHTANPQAGGGGGGLRTRWDEGVGNGPVRGGPGGRRNTVQGGGRNAVLGMTTLGGDQVKPTSTLQGGTGGGIPQRPKATLKRRLSLAEELALLGEESDEDEDEEDEHVAEEHHNGGNDNKASSSGSEEESKDEESSDGDEDSSEEESEDDESDSESSGVENGARARARQPTVNATPIHPTTTSSSKINGQPGKAASAPLSANGTARGGGAGANTTAREAKRKSVGTPSVASRHTPQAPNSGQRAVANRWR